MKQSTRSGKFVWCVGACDCDLEETGQVAGGKREVEG